MPTRRTSTGNPFAKFVKQRGELAISASVDVLDYVGLEFVKEARTARRYIDRTGNLRSSIGYFVLEEGKVVKKGGFSPVSSTATAGPSEGREFIAKIASEYPEGIVLIGVAGMSYAAYVEAHGLNVTDSATVLAKRLVPQLLRNLGLI
jgi:S-methylmethionine-dependent homocysteine/selenocysteine methylase